MSVEFKIGRLRYTWKGYWDTATFYNRDAVVSYEGKTYVCLEPHTSTGFNADLTFYDSQLGSLPRWELMIDGRSWKQEWLPNTYYFFGNIVTYGGAVYICIDEHTSGSSQIDLTKWTTYSQYDNWDSAWATSTVYGEGDIVRYGGIVYRCVTDHVSAATTTLGLEPDLSKWEVVNAGIEYKGNWSTSTRYKLNDLVRNGTDIYKCTAGHTSATMFDQTKWSLWFPGVEYNGSWDMMAVYQPGDIAIYGGYSYVCLTINNQNNIPSTESADWELVTQGFRSRQTWINGSSYRVGDVVTRGGTLYVCIADTSGDDPTDNDGLDTDFWNVVVPGVSWRNFWESGVTYVVGELVSWQNVTYKCLVTHIANSVTRPDQGTTDWEVYVIHATENAGNTAGDLVVYKDGAPTAVQILPTGASVGATEDYLLKINGTQPNWAKIFALPDVYYVAPTGTDSVEFGKTWDEPWKTIKYACEKVGAGQYFLNANALLEANKDFLVEEMYLWMLAQKAANQSPFTTSSVFDEAATKRDAKFVIDAISHDIVRGSNSRTITTAKQYFKENSTTTFFNTATDDAQAYIVASLNRIRAIIPAVVSGTDPDVVYQRVDYVWDEFSSYQTDDIVFYGGTYYISLIDENSNPTDTVEAWAETTTPVGIIEQYKNPSLVPESGWLTELQSLLDLIIDAIDNATTENLPNINTGATATIYVKTGTYSEMLPIVIPDGTALVGDELRGTVVQPASTVYTSTTSCSTLTDRFNFRSVTGLEVGMPIQFSASGINDDFGGVTLGQTYYVAEIVNNTVAVSETVGGDIVGLTSGVGNMTVYAGECLKDMFYMRDATGLRNMTLTGLAGSLGAPNQFTTQRPTGGAYTSLDPGTGPNDTRTWIITRSPYCQNVTNFGVGCVGMKIDGRLHNGGNRSMVANDYTQILSDGIGVWCTGPNSLTECVSVFAYYNYAGYMAEDGGRIRATNGNSSYGVYGVIAEGYDDTENPIAGIVDNRSSQVQASVQSAFGTSAEILSLEFTNAGSNYYEQTTNLLKYSNLFTSWSNDGNVTVQKNTTSPFGETDGWTLTGTTSSTDTSYVYQDIAILAAGGEYANVAALNVTGAGQDATFDITVGSTSYAAAVNLGGTNYVYGAELRVPGSLLGGLDGTNDCFLTVSSLAGSAILEVTVTGTVPTNSNQSYTISAYVKQGTSPTVDLQAMFDTNVTTTVTYNFNTGNLTASAGTLGALPKSYDKLELTNGWYRIWMTVYDKPALNDVLQVRLYPRGISGLSGSTKFYGLQAQLTDEPTFYLETTTNQFTSNANFSVVGAGTGAELLGDEIRSNGVFETRITDTGTGVGGRGYLVGSNNAQGGDDTYIILAGSDVNTETNYVGMRVFIESGTGAGQYGYISAYDDAVTKVADVLKESFEPLVITSTDSGTSIFTLGSGYTTDTMYVDQAVQFIPTYYSTNVTKTGIDSLIVTTTIGGSTNTLTVSDTSKLTVNMPIQFSGTVFGGVTTNFTYYVREIIDGTTFDISTEIFGTQWLLNSATGSMTMTFPGYNNYIEGTTSSMQINMPINFTGLSIGGISVGTTYYVNEVISSQKFTISTTLVEVTATATAAGTNYITTSVPTTQLVPLNPITFSGTTFGGITAGSTYYINKIVNSSTFTVVSALTETTATHTETLSNLITVTSTTGFIVNNPIQFIGKTTGGIVNGTTYYILAINDETTFTISTTPGGSAVNLSTSDCGVLVRTTPAPATLTNASGTMTGTSTNAKTTLTAAYGSMNGTYSTSLYGNVTKGTTYYVKTIDSSNTFTVTDTLGGGTAVTLKTDTGSMNIAAVGWDHIHPGTPIAANLDNSSIYYVEPKIKFGKPGYSQTLTTVTTAAGGTVWTSVAYGNGKFIAVPNGNAIASISTDGGETWDALSLPTSNEWGAIAFGDGRWVLTSATGLLNNQALYSINDGEGWRSTTLPASATWSNLVYGNGKFVTIASGSTNCAYSTNYGQDWTAGSGLPSRTWTGIAYGQGKFVAVASSTNTVAYSTNGITWSTSTMPKSSNWSSVAYGNGLFVAVDSTGGYPAYSTDGINWIASPYSLGGLTSVTYGQGVFLAGNSTSNIAYTTEDGFSWVSRSIEYASFNAVTFGWDPVTKDGIFVTVGGTTSGSIVKAGSTTKARVNVTSGTIDSITIFEPGSNYGIVPSVVISDPNITLTATTTVRVGDGALGNPTFINKGQDYNTNSTVVTINGGGYADQYQSGLTLIVKNLTSLPAPGDDLVIAGNDTVYKVTSAIPVYGTVAPNIMANIEVSPEITVAKSPEHELAVTIRTKYSQCRLTGHDFLNVGYGNLIQSNYPNLPADTVLAPQDQAVEVNYGRVFYTSTDQDGNFKVGGLFGVEQATGIVTLSATQFGLTGLETLSLGGIAVGGASVVVRQFSTDSTFIANSNEIIPTQRAIKAYLTSRLSQGGANTFTGQLTAGTVVVGGADKIRSTIPEGNAGWVVNMPVMTRVHGEFAGWDGDGMALAYFIKTWNHR